MARGGTRGRKTAEARELVTDVLVIGGGPAGAWAAITARGAGCEVVLADKGFLGTSGATAPSNTETWIAPPGEPREQAIARHVHRTGGFAETDHIRGVLEDAWRGLHLMVEWGYPFPADTHGKPYIGNLRGPDYMRFLRRRAIAAGVEVLDHHPALELIGDDEGIGGAAGSDRVAGIAWRVRASAVVLATGGCAFGERILGATGLTGDGYLMAVEAGAALSGLEFSAQYAVTPLGTSLNKGMPYRWATFYDADGRDMGDLGDDRQTAIAHALLKGPVSARLDKASAQERDWLRRGQPNCFLPFDRCGIDPFTEKFPIGLRCEGTVRGTGGIRLVSAGCETGVAGLYAAGDAASREDLVGAITGGGGPNSSWAIASGLRAGAAAAAFATTGRSTRDRRRLVGLGQAGLRPHGQRRARTAFRPVTDVIASVRAEMLPIERNFFRSADGLRDSLHRLGALWPDVNQGFGRGFDRTQQSIARDREAAALLATSRWVLASALGRDESRGMHRRTDHPATSAAAPRRLLVRGVHAIEVGAS